MNELMNLEQYRGPRSITVYRWTDGGWVRLSTRTNGRNIEMVERQRRRYYTDGRTEVLTTHPPEGWVPGRVMSGGDIKRKAHRWKPCWWNNGIEQVSALECPEGFVKGMLKSRRKPRSDRGVARDEYVMSGEDRAPRSDRGGKRPWLVNRRRVVDE